MRSRGHFFSYITIFIIEQWNLDVANVQGTDKSVRYKEVPLYRGSFPVYYYWDRTKNVIRYTEDPVR